MGPDTPAAPPVDDNCPADNLIRALAFLKQNIHMLHNNMNTKTILIAAAENWNPEPLRNLRSLPIGV